MLIEALAKLAHGCGAEGISLEIPPSDGGNVKVLVVTRLGHGARVAQDEKHASRLAVLAQPVVVGGHPGEIDQKLLRMIDEIEEGLIQAAGELPETDAKKRLKALAEAGKQEDKTSGEKTAKADAPKTQDAGAKAEAEPTADAFADDDAESL